MKKIEKHRYLYLYITVVSAIAVILAILSLNVLAAEKNYYINYIDEKIYFDYKFDGSTNAPKYMYSLNADLLPNEKKQSVEKWYPVYGSTLDISKYIPKVFTREYIIAIRLADEMPDINGVYASRQALLIKGRPNLTDADLKKLIEYNPLTEKIELDKELLDFGYDYQIGLSEWVYNRKEDLAVSSKYNPLGTVVVIRRSSNHSAETFASISTKIKIPKAPNTPKLKINESTKKIVGISTIMAWSVTENGEYTLFTDKTVDLSMLAQKTTTLSSYKTEKITDSKTSKTEDYIVLYVKVAATDKKPSSGVQKLLIKKSLLTIAAS